MEIIEVGGHNEMCGGYSYSYEITFGKYGNTLKDVLKELKEYSYEHSFGHLGDFGNPNIDIWVAIGVFMLMAIFILVVGMERVNEPLSRRITNLFIKEMNLK